MLSSFFPFGNAEAILIQIRLFRTAENVSRSNSTAYHGARTRAGSHCLLEDSSASEEYPNAIGRGGGLGLTLNSHPRILQTDPHPSASSDENSE
jgi:hypothetical protein